MKTIREIDAATRASKRKAAQKPPQPTHATEPDWSKPQAIDDLTSAFGPRNIGDLLPAMSAIPDDFKHHRNQWAEMVSKWFFSGLPNDTETVAKPGIDAKAAMQHVGACLRSFEPKHEHKTAGCAYLLSLWFDQFGEAK